MENTTENQKNQEQTSNHNEVDNQYEEALEKLKIRIKNIENNSKFAFGIIISFTQGCISAENDLTKIGANISKIINTDKIKGNPDLVFNIINGFVHGCLMKKPDNIKDIAESFLNLFNSNFGKNEKKIKDRLKPMFSLIVSQYFMNILTNSGSKQLSEEDKKQTETKLFECYKKLFHVEDKKGFQDIPLKELLDLQDEYLKEKFKKNDMNSGGLEYETFLKMACSLMLKSEGNKELTIKDLEEQKDIFKDLKFIYLGNKKDIISKKELFNAIGLESKDFGTDKKGSDFGIVYCSYLNHAFVMVIDKKKEWCDAINSDIKSIYLIDSSRSIEHKKQRNILSEGKEQIFKTAKTLNQHYQKNGTCWINAMSAVGFLLERQQERIAEQKQEQREQVEQTEQQPRKPYGLSINELLEGFDKKQDDESKKNVNSPLENKTYPSVENAHYYPQDYYPPQDYQPFHNYNSRYGLRNYPVQYPFVRNAHYYPQDYYPPQDYQPFHNYNSRYGLRNYPVQYPFVRNAHNTCNYSLEENLSLFEQGICDYSTEHFYTLINLSKKEKYIITKFLAKQVEQNKADQEKLKTMSERLEASKIKQFEALTVERQKTNKEEISKISGDLTKELSAERIIIKYTYLKESLERIAQDADKLEKFCIRFGIFEPNQEENSSNKKRSSSSCLGDIASVEETSEYQKATEITKQSVVDKTQQMLQNRIK